MTKKLKQFPTKQDRAAKGQKFSVIDAHNERVQIKREHPERPTLTAWALSILFPKGKR